MNAVAVAPSHPWLEATRPRTLPASIAPVLVGTAASTRAGAALFSPGSEAIGVLWWRFVLAMVVAVALQIAVNLANDLFDGVRGVDTDDRVGPRRMVASGIIQPDEMKQAVGLALLVAAVAGAWLALLAGPWLVLVGVAAGLASLGYSGGPRPYASQALGEVFVFLFFGVVATVGSAFVQDEVFHVLPWLAAVPMGALASALLVVNNLRDIPTDTAAGKRTLAVRLGEHRTRLLYVGLVNGALAFCLVLALAAGEGWLALPLLSVPLAAKGLQVVRNAPIGPLLIQALGHTAQAQLAYAALLTLGLLLRNPLG